MISTERGSGSPAKQTQKAAAMSQPTIDARQPNERFARNDFLQVSVRSH